MRDLKVLWFTNMMMPEFSERLGIRKSVIGGWMPSLAEAVKKYAPQIELCIASEGPIQTAIRIGGIEYVSLGMAKRNRKIFPSLRHIRSEFKSAVVNCVKAFKPDVIQKGTFLHCLMTVGVVFRVQCHFREL